MLLESEEFNLAMVECSLPPVEPNDFRTLGTLELPVGRAVCDPTLALPLSLGWGAVALGAGKLLLIFCVSVSIGLADGSGLVLSFSLAEGFAGASLGAGGKIASQDFFLSPRWVNMLEASAMSKPAITTNWIALKIGDSFRAPGGPEGL
jgi:hypothetical protein